MIYKVYYQESKLEIPVRECTKALYVEAESEREVRLKLKEEPYNIEFVQKLDNSHLEYEQQSEYYKVEN
ncbi:DNA-dependent RNA polymerase subunit epsilon [Rossellomorea sp. BNER]|jgi:DNA-dependent RNA polymerase auxiliary subunit epsilon|uniref:DNA-dependent RNA polymerase subunit epsilon n=1 Tax=Rossellomorea sp. BNER TaxID=2962031 RepID=UPI003AF21CD8|nr:DNA-directed RNA polymerase subunit epsilon [Rossellomorea sp. BNER]